MADEVRPSLATAGVLRRELPTLSPEPVPVHADMVDVAQLLGTLRQHKKTVLGVAALTFFVIMLVTLASHMRFRSSGRLYLGELGTKEKGLGGAAELDLSGGGQGDLSSEIEIIRSRSLVERAILDCGANVSLSPRGWAPPHYLGWLLSRRDPQLLAGAGGELRAVQTRFTEQTREPRKYLVRFVSDVEYELIAERQLLGRGRAPTTIWSCSPWIRRPIVCSPRWR